MSWLVGMFLNSLFMKHRNYNKLCDLNFIKNEKINDTIGLKAFKWIVKNTFFKLFNDKIKIEKVSKKPALHDLRVEMTYSEISHLVGFVFVLFFVIFRITQGEFAHAFVILIVNILMNLYPSLLQQQNKRRIDRLSQRYG